MFAAGIAFMLAVANVYFRDTQYFLTIVLQMWMYLTPIIYPVSLVKTESDKHGGLFGTPITILDLFHLNPMEHFVNVFRQLIYDNRWPDGSEWLICACWAVASLVIGLVVFRRNERNLAEML
jgi:ABC-2 type transport system permease protein